MTDNVIQFLPRLLAKKLAQREASEQAALAQGIPGPVQARSIPINDNNATAQDWETIHARLLHLQGLLHKWQRRLDGSL